MILDNIYFHNVEEVEKTILGYKMWRLPHNLREKVNERIAQRTSAFGTGIELRFRIKGDFADIFLRAEEAAEAQVAYIYYGSFQAGWEYSSRVIGTEITKIHIPYPKNINVLNQLTIENNLPFSPEIVRIILPYCTCYYVGMEGNVETPTKQDMPSQTYLAYGSSITHGCLSLASPYSYPFRISQALGCDYLNFGFAGSAYMEKEMAKYIVSRKEWDFASFEMGINMLGFKEEDFEKQIYEFTNVLAEDHRPIFVTNIFVNNEVNQEKVSRFRQIVKRYCQDRFIFTDGLELLGNSAYISQDLTHPSLEGICQISDRWGRIIRKFSSSPPLSYENI